MRCVERSENLERRAHLKKSVRAKREFWTTDSSQKEVCPSEARIGDDGLISKKVCPSEARILDDGLILKKVCPSEAII